MELEWPIVRLGDHVDACLGKMLDAKKNRGELKPYLGNSNVRWGTFDLTDLAQMRFEAHEDERYGLLPGDLIVCEGGEPGRCAIWTGQASEMKVQKALHRIRTKPSLNNYYLYYWFCYAAKAGQLEPFFTGTTIKHLTGKAIASLKIPLPPIDTQITMVEILRRIDECVHELRETNTTLEAIAQAIFKSWFIDFDPVKAKSVGRVPDGIDAATAALFPDSFEESALGAIPRGWTVDAVGNVAECVGGGTPSTKEDAFWEPGTHHWVTPKDLSGLNSPVLLETERKLSPLGLQKVSSGLLPKGTLLLSSRAPIGYLALAEIPLAVNQGFIAMKPGGRLPPEYLYFWTASAMDEIKQKANGSTFMEISKSAFRPIKLVVPDGRVVNAFQGLATAIFETIATNEAERQTLTELRDALLPRLISGKLKLPELEEIAEAL